MHPRVHWELGTGPPSHPGVHGHASAGAWTSPRVHRSRAVCLGCIAGGCILAASALHPHPGWTLRIRRDQRPRPSSLPCGLRPARSPPAPGSPSRRCRIRLPGTRAPGGVVQQRPDGSQHHGLLGCARRAREHPRGHDRAQAQHFAALAPVPARGHHPGRRCPESDRLPWGPCGGKIPHPSSQPPPAPVTTRLPLPRILFCHHQEGRPPHGGGEGPREIGGGLQQTLTSPVRRGASRGVMSVTVVTVSPGPATRALLGGVGYEGTRLPRRGGSRQTLTTVTNPHPPRRPLPGTRCRRRADPSGLAASGARYHAPGAGLP